MTEAGLFEEVEVEPALGRIAEGCHAAHVIELSLMGWSDLPKPLGRDNDRRPFV